jgi:hypothetical protein
VCIWQTLHTNNPTDLWNMLELISKFSKAIGYDPLISLLRICTNRIKSFYQKDMCAIIFIAALFTTNNIWGQTECPWKGFFKNLIYISCLHVIHINIDEREEHVLNEINQVHKDEQCSFPFICGFYEVDVIEVESQNVTTKSLGQCWCVESRIQNYS